MRLFRAIETPTPVQLPPAQRDASLRQKFKMDNAQKYATLSTPALSAKLLFSTHSRVCNGIAFALGIVSPLLSAAYITFLKFCLSISTSEAMRTAHINVRNGTATQLEKNVSRPTRLNNRLLIGSMIVSLSLGSLGNAYMNNWKPVSLLYNQKLFQSAYQFAGKILFPAHPSADIRN